MQVEQAGIDGGQVVLHLRADFQVGFQGVGQVADLALDTQVDAAQFVVEAGEQGVEQHGGHRPTLFGDVADVRPRTQQADLENLPAQQTDTEQGAPVFFVATEWAGQRIQQLHQIVRQKIEAAAGLQFLTQATQIDILPLAIIGLRRQFRQQAEQRRFHRDQPGQTLGRSVLDATAQEHGQRQIVAQNAHLLQLVQHADDLVAAYAEVHHQLVGADSLVVTGVDQQRDQVEIAALDLLGEIPFGEMFFRLFQRWHLETAGKNPRVVFVALKKARPLEPGNGGANLGVGIGVVGLDAAFPIVGGENLTGRDNDFAAPGLA